MRMCLAIAAAALPALLTSGGPTATPKLVPVPLLAAEPPPPSLVRPVALPGTDTPVPPDLIPVPLTPHGN
jgi:hypothetical protein